jgi:DNA-binding LacI/PurR family transcriptional regulator
VREAADARGDDGSALGVDGNRATIYEVARRAGVSVSTVSRAFRAPSMLRVETRERVREAAEVLGYVPNRAAGGLTTGRTSNLALVVPDMANPFFPLLVKAAQSRARAAQYAMFLVDTDEDAAAEAQAIRAMAKQVDGVILCAPRMSDEHLHGVAQLAPLVLVNRRAGGIPAVTIDMGGGMREAVTHLHALGHLACVYVAGPRASWSSRQRRKAFRAAARRLGMAAFVLEPFEPRYQAGLQAADRLLAAGATAVIAYNDLVALGIRARLAQRGVVVPDEMSVVGFDDIAMASMASPPLTSVAMPTAAAGRAAVELMLQVLGESPGDERGRYELRTELRVRASTGPCPSAVNENGKGRAGEGRAGDDAP